MKRALIVLAILLAGCVAAPAPSPTAVLPTPTPYTCSCKADTYKCRSFASRREAQVCFDYCMDQTGLDVHHLDGDGDGRVCEG